MERNLHEILKDLSISKINEIEKKPSVKQNIFDIYDTVGNVSKLGYVLACTSPKQVDVTKIAPHLEKTIKHESMLRAVYNYVLKNNYDIENFVKSNDLTKDEINSNLKTYKGDKKQILRKAKQEMPCVDFKIVIELLNSMETETIKIEEVKDWLDDGEVSKLHKPGENKQLSEEIRQEHLKRTGGKVVTRFPPEPNGVLHIGHAKAINFSFCYANKFNGYTFLRYDDTNPRNEDECFFDDILKDVEWLGFKPKAITASSDYFEKMLEFSKKLIREGNAYVCHCSLEDVRARRRTFQEKRDQGEVDPLILSPSRNRTSEENMKEFEKMLNKEYKEGDATLRFKMDLESKNPLMLDLVGARIIDMVHPRRKENFYVYPSYEFALCVADSLEDVTHSFCSREFKTRQESYHWLLQKLELYEPVQWEFSRLDLSNTVLSKRKINVLGLKLDDPRLYTISAMRRRGFTPTAVNNFVRSVGITFSETVVDVRILENFVREDLLKVADKMFLIKEPIKLKIKNPKKMKVDCFGHEVDVYDSVYISRSDFKEESSDDFYRLTKNQSVGLLRLGVVKFVSKTDDGIEVEYVDEKPKSYVQWLCNLNNEVEIRLYSKLFSNFNVEDYKSEADLEGSLKIEKGYVDGRILKGNIGDKYQAVRVGFFCIDSDTTKDKIVLNLTLPLKNLQN